MIKAIIFDLYETLMTHPHGKPPKLSMAADSVSARRTSKGIRADSLITGRRCISISVILSDVFPTLSAVHRDCRHSRSRPAMVGLTLVAG